MALTRPKISQINTKVTALTDPITVLNAGATTANVDSGFLINRAHGLISNAAIYYSETLDTFVTAFTGNSGGADSNIAVSSYVDITTGNVYTTGLYWNGNGLPVTLGTVYGDSNVASYLSSYFTYANANAAVQSINIDSINANITAVNVAIADLQSNAASQAILLNFLTGNAASQSTVLDELIANAAVQSANLTYLIGNAAAQEASLTSLLGNAASQSTVLDSINANIGAYQTYANANLVIQSTNFDTLSANVGAYEIWSNANAASQQVQIDSISANIGDYQIYANANAASQQTYLTNIDANVTAVNIAILGLQSNAAFQANLLDILTGNAATQGSLLDELVSNAAIQSANLTYLLSNAAAQEANLTSLLGNAASQSGAIDTISANIGAYQFWSNANAAVQAVSIDSLNANVAAANAAIITANTGMKSYVDDQFVLAGGYGNTQVGAYLTVHTGNITAGNIDVSGNIVGGSVRTTTGATAPINPTPGDMWYDTSTDVLFRYTDTGTTRYWLDINGQTLSFDLTGNVVSGNVIAYGYYWANGEPFVSSVYDNSNVAAYLGPYFIYANTNAATQTTSIDTINANIGAYQTWSNANAVSQATAIATLQTQVYDNTNTAAYLTGNITVGNVVPIGNNIVNLGSPTARFGSLYLAGNTIDLGGILITTTANGSIVISGDLSISGNVSAAVPFYSNANVASYLTTYTGNITANTITTTGNITADTLKTTNGLFWANGTAFSSGGVTQARAWATTMLFGG